MSRLKDKLINLEICPLCGVDTTSQDYQFCQVCRQKYDNNIAQIKYWYPNYPAKKQRG